MNNINTVALPRQANLSDEIRGILKRAAAMNGGLASFMRKVGIGSGGHGSKRTGVKVSSLTSSRR